MLQLMESKATRNRCRTKTNPKKTKRKAALHHAQGLWRKEEHERFLVGLQLFPQGPWKAIAEIVQTRTAKQSQTHMQKCKEKMLRKLREHNLSRTPQLPHSDGNPASNRCKQAESLNLSAVTPIPFTNPTLGEKLTLVPPEEATSVSLEDSLDFFIENMPMNRLRI
ncbi:hypothetical protein THRCLA_03159 [Thraustotheca clavata]|uniref:Myb-like domain-containing protein n=1 Tax=Thraustotheca clavata TaxID=74557 RepID=A0A1W0A361_9STRA|nr:hypothetical protein THRCLA_03159 [Thraustotheca clavata]